MTRRRRSDEREENTERWLVSYADFITLLFAFFVVMYSISSVNEGKYRVLSDSLVAAFRDTSVRPPARTADAISAERGTADRDTAQARLDPTPSTDVIDLGGTPSQDDPDQLEVIAKQIETVLAPFIEEELVAVKRHDAWVEIEMKSGLFFASGSAELSRQSLPMLHRLSDILSGTDNPIHVEGHTDNLPINTPQFPSNWELSSARAASVVHQFMRNGIRPDRMAAIGYGEYHPVADNGTEPGRYQNRRVVIILKSQRERPRPAFGAAIRFHTERIGKLGKPGFSDVFRQDIRCCQSGPRAVGFHS